MASLPLSDAPTGTSTQQIPSWAHHLPLPLHAKSQSTPFKKSTHPYLPICPTWKSGKHSRLLILPHPPPVINLHMWRRQGFPDGSDGKESACSKGGLGSIPGREDHLEEGMTTHSSILVWRIPWIEEPGGLQSMGSQRVRYDWATKHNSEWGKFLKVSIPA